MSSNRFLSVVFICKYLQCHPVDGCSTGCAPLHHCSKQWKPKYQSTKHYLVKDSFGYSCTSNLMPHHHINLWQNSIETQWLDSLWHKRIHTLPSKMLVWRSDIYVQLEAGFKITLFVQLRDIRELCCAKHNKCLNDVRYKPWYKNKNT